MSSLLVSSSAGGSSSRGKSQAVPRLGVADSDYGRPEQARATGVEQRQPDVAELLSSPSGSSSERSRRAQLSLIRGRRPRGRHMSRRPENESRPSPPLFRAVLAGLPACLAALAGFYLACSLPASGSLASSRASSPVAVSPRAIAHVASHSPAPSQAHARRQLAETPPHGDMSHGGPLVCDASPVGRKGPEQRGLAANDGGKSGARRSGRKRARGRAVREAAEEVFDGAELVQPATGLVASAGPRGRRTRRKRARRAAEAIATEESDGGGETTGASQQIFPAAARAAGPSFTDTTLDNHTREELAGLTVQADDMPGVEHIDAWYASSATYFKALIASMSRRRSEARGPQRSVPTVRGALTAIARAAFAHAQFRAVRRLLPPHPRTASLDDAVALQQKLGSWITQSIFGIFGEDIQPVVSELEDEVLRTAVGAYNGVHGRMRMRPPREAPDGKMSFLARLGLRRSLLVSALSGRNPLLDLGQLLDRRPDIRAALPADAFLLAAVRAQRAALRYGLHDPRAQLLPGQRKPRRLPFDVTGIAPDPGSVPTGIAPSEASGEEWAVCLSRALRLARNNTRGVRYRMVVAPTEMTLNRLLQRLADASLLLSHAAAVSEVHPAMRDDPAFVMCFRQLRAQVVSTWRRLGIARTASDRLTTLLFPPGGVPEEAVRQVADVGHPTRASLGERLEKYYKGVWMQRRTVDLAPVFARALLNDSKFLRRPDVKTHPGTLVDLLRRRQHGTLPFTLRKRMRWAEPTEGAQPRDPMRIASPEESEPSDSSGRQREASEAIQVHDWVVGMSDTTGGNTRGGGRGSSLPAPEQSDASPSFGPLDQEWSVEDFLQEAFSDTADARVQTDDIEYLDWVLSALPPSDPDTAGPGGVSASRGNAPSHPPEVADPGQLPPELDLLLEDLSEIIAREESEEQKPRRR